MTNDISARGPIAFVGVSRYSARRRCGGPVGPPAMANRKPRQARKGATVAVTPCAGMWLVGPSPLSIRVNFPRFRPPLSPS